MHIDKFPFADKTVSYTQDYEKIEKNLKDFQSINDVYKLIEIEKSKNRNGIATFFNLLNYLVYLRIDFRTNEDSLMYFFDLNIDIKTKFLQTRQNNLLSDKEIEHALHFQTELKKDVRIKQQAGEIFFTAGKTFEIPTNFDNIYFCNIDDIVISKAKELNIYESIERTDLAQQTYLVQEKTTDKQKNKIVDFFCFVHSEKHKNPDDNGFIYIRFNDVLSNLNKMDDFFEIISFIARDFDKVIFTNFVNSISLN